MLQRRHYDCLEWYFIGRGRHSAAVNVRPCCGLNTVSWQEFARCQTSSATVLELHRQVWVLLDGLSLWCTSDLAYLTFTETSIEQQSRSPPGLNMSVQANAVCSLHRPQHRTLDWQVKQQFHTCRQHPVSQGAVKYAQAEWHDYQVNHLYTEGRELSVEGDVNIQTLLRSGVLPCYSWWVYEQEAVCTRCDWNKNTFKISHKKDLDMKYKINYTSNSNIL